MPVDADHRSVCRFSDPKDPRFQPVLSALSTMITETAVVEGLPLTLQEIRSQMLISARKRDERLATFIVIVLDVRAHLIGPSLPGNAILPRLQGTA